MPTEADYPLIVDIAFFVVVTGSALAAGFVLGLLGGEAYQRRVADQILRRLAAALHETEQTLEQIRGNKRPQRPPAAGGFDIRSGGGVPPADDYDRWPDHYRGPKPPGAGT